MERFNGVGLLACHATMGEVVVGTDTSSERLISKRTTDKPQDEKKEKTEPAYFLN
jgi:hypothetical protein